jgi:hypothetical protein
MTYRKGFVAALCGLAAAAASGMSGLTASAGTSTVTVVAQGLNNPRGLAFGADGGLFVAEAGTGGSSCVAGPRGPSCFGLTGSISRLVDGHVHRIVSGLASNASPNGQGATGPDGLSRREDGGLYTIITAAPQLVPPGLPPALTEALRDQAGQLLRVGDGGFSAVAGVGAFDFAWTARHPSINPQYPDANPYGVLALENRIYVVDAASNTLDLIEADGSVRVIALFPNPPVNDAVPTCIDRGPDGALYVGELTGGGNAPGSAVVFRVVPGEKPTVWQSGFTTITGCGFGATGSFYVTEFQTGGLGAPSPAGDVIRISRDGTRTSIGGGQVFLPNGFLAGPDGSIYVSNWSVLPGTSAGGSPTGEVIRISG